ncbi:MAG TPA: hypothetical protein VJI69_06370, partial [Bacteroidia bacterium]|nr:hypothetical protein [Bacteroidia bacterium]
MAQNEYPKILIGCPTAEFKRYALDRYINGLQKIKYPNFDILIVDNSESNRYFETLQLKVNKVTNPNAKNVKIIKDKFHESARDRIISSRNIIRQIFLEGDYEYFLSLEQDIVPPQNIVDRLLFICKQTNSKIATAVYFNNQV